MAVNALTSVTSLKTEGLPACWQSVLSPATVRLELEQLKEKLGMN